MRDRLAVALARNVGQVLTFGLARDIAREVFAERDLSIDPSLFPVERWGSFDLACEPLHSTGDLAKQRLDYLRERYPDAPNATDWPRLLAAQRDGVHVTFTARQHGLLSASLWLWLSVNIDTGVRTATDDLFYVMPELRGGMLAVRLWQYAERAMFDYGVREAVFHSRADNGAVRMAKFMGYRAVATRVVKSHSGDDYSGVVTRHTQATSRSPA